MLVRSLFAFLILFISNSVFASTNASYGVGASVRGNTSTFYLPVKFDGYFIEPRVSYTKNSPSNGSSYTSTYIDSGFFLTKQLQEKLGLYYGARLGYNNDKYSSVSNSTYILAPTLGLEVFPFKQASVGIEYRLQFSRMNAQSYHTNSIQSTTDLVFRYYFN